MNPDPGAAPAAPPVRIAEVTAGYADGPDVLKGVTLTVRSGEIALVHGPHGSGKTSLLHLLRGALRPRSGSASVLGQDPLLAGTRDRARMRRGIGFVAAAPLLLEEATAFQNVAGPEAPFERDPVIDPARAGNVRDLMGFLGLEGVSAKAASTLSASERRLLALARAVINRPALLLADDPGGGLSADYKARIVRLLSELAKQGAAIVLVSQTPDAYQTLAAVRWRIEQGRLGGAT